MSGNAKDPSPEPRDPAPGDIVRMVARSHIVRDLDDTLRRLSLNLDWEPAGRVEVIAAEGYRPRAPGTQL